MPPGPGLLDGFRWGKKGVKYLGVHLGDQSEVMKSWEGVVKKMEGRLKEWHWLSPKISYRGAYTYY